ncbi:MAG: DNA (cytosine-5-)-methyltransferase [Propionibacteriaceae bacterium]|nr:DNA (cytosine-5-)-methyltransferase [Propionibacteriaceae bacterium]
MTDLAVTSTFSGVGGIDLGFRAAGIPTRLLCEYDKHAASVLARRFPSVPIHPDVTELTADDLTAAGLRPESTILAGGFPCQDLSVAGARRGMGEGTRSGLYWHLDRLMGEFRPAWVLLENVPGLLSATCACPGDGRCGDSCEGQTHSVAGGGPCPGGCIPSHGGVMGAVLGSLAERGYGFAYRVLDAQFFGVPQRRRRVVIVGRLGDSGAAPAQVLLEPEGGGWDPPARFPTGPGTTADVARGAGKVGVDVVGTLTAKAEGGWRVGADEAAAGQLVPVTFQKVVRSGERDAEGNLPPEVWAQRDVAATLNLHDLGSDTRAVDVVVQPLAIRGRDEGSQLEVAPEGSPAHSVRTPGGGSSHPMVAVTTLGSRTHALTAEGHDASEDDTGRGTPIVTAPQVAATLTAGVSKPGTNPPGRRQEDDHNLVAFHLTQDPISGDVSPAMGAKSTGMGIHTETTVRRLTPMECERLQGHPDNWTEGQADSHRYKQMGNGVAVPVFAWVAHRLAAVHEAGADPRPCPDCGGTGDGTHYPCETCHGSGAA